ncbi:MAG: hypothetical protein MK098_11880 [Marinovum sp.]|nr:hypothetical protein [Marinovum sp.]
MRYVTWAAMAIISLVMIVGVAIYYYVAHTPLPEAIPTAVVLVCCGLMIARKGGGLIG